MGQLQILLASLRRLGHDQRGTVLVQFAVYLVAVFSLVGLALDASRALILHSSLQDVADAAALAAAARLDGTDAAITSAKSAAQSIADQNKDNVFRLWEPAGSTTLQFNFYEPDTADPNKIGSTADGTPSLARYVTVTVGSDNSWQVTPTFLAVLGVSSAHPTATATARVRYPSCSAIHSYMCTANFGNPSAGTMFTLSDKASGGAGNWGITDLPPDYSDYSQFFAAKHLPACPEARIDQRTGNGQHKDIVTGINVRFDQPVSNGTADQSLTAPLPVDGLKPNGGCKSFSAVYPKDFDQTNEANYNKCSANSCPMPQLSANFGTYWQNHHGAGTWPTYPPGDSKAGQPMTRYDAYNYEYKTFAGAWSSDGKEPHAPSCSAKIDDSMFNGRLTRRVLSIALLDTCPKGNSGGPYPFTKYADFFITEPASLVKGQPNVIAEFVAVHEAGDGGVLHKTVELVR